MTKVYFLPHSQRKLKKLPSKEISKIERAINNISQKPTSGKKLRGELKGLYVSRAWPYRIIYKIERNYVAIIHVSHRQRVYK